MLLRKTTAASVNKIAPLVFKKYGTPSKLAVANARALSKILQPLGLNKIRSKAMIGMAKVLIVWHKGRVPADYNSLYSLPHVGRYTANAVLCFGFDQRRPIVDSNIVRLFQRFFNTEKPVEVHKADKLWRIAEQLLPKRNAKRFNSYLLDLAMTVCVPRNPNCSACPLTAACHYFRESKSLGLKSAR